MPNSELFENQFFSDNPDMSQSENIPKRNIDLVQNNKAPSHQNYDVSGQPFDAKFILTSLKSSDTNDANPYMPKMNGGKREMSSNADSSNNNNNLDSLSLNAFDESLSESDVLGKVSLAYTSTPSSVLNLTQFGSLSSLTNHPLARPTNAGASDDDDDAASSVAGRKIPSEPLEFTAPIVKARFVALSWSEPMTTNGDILAYSVIYKVKGSVR